MSNPYRGEVSLTLNGQAHAMRLSLGALASMEAQMEADSLMALVERFESGAFKTVDLTVLLFAGLQGAGWDGCHDDLCNAQIEGGIVQAAKLAGQLLRITFGSPE
jgi:hypothetical protein